MSHAIIRKLFPFFFSFLFPFLLFRFPVVPSTPHNSCFWGPSWEETLPSVLEAFVHMFLLRA